MSRIYKCLRRCHGFRGGTWDEGDEVEVADGELINRHFVPKEEWEAAKEAEKRPKVKVDIMNPKPAIMGQQTLNSKGGMGVSIKADKRKKPINRVAAGEDI